jgi:hypothetical protein
LVPRHPPIALSSLSQKQTTKDKITLQRDARVHYTVLKIRAGTPTPNHHLPGEHPTPGKQHTQKQNTHTNRLVRAGPSHPPTPTPDPQRPNSRCSSDPEKPVHVSNETRPDSSGPNSAPRPFTLMLSAFHAPSEEKCSTNSITRDPGLMVNVPHSEAPPPWNGRPGNDE